MLETPRLPCNAPNHTSQLCHNYYGGTLGRKMDRASEFVGRSLYVLESAFIEAFKPLDGACRLDAAVKVNKVYLAAMFRHMQVGSALLFSKTWSCCGPLC